MHMLSHLSMTLGSFMGNDAKDVPVWSEGDLKTNESFAYKTRRITELQGGGTASIFRG